MSLTNNKLVKSHKHVPLTSILLPKCDHSDHILTVTSQYPDNVKFHDMSLTVHSTPAHVKCHLYPASTSVIVSGGVGMQQCMI